MITLRDYLGKMVEDCLEKITMTFGENKMNKFKKGDKVNITDGSYCFGIKNGEYSNYCNCFDGSRKNLTVIETGLCVAKTKGILEGTNDLSGEFSAVNDLLVTDNRGSFWFTQSRFCQPVETSHRVVLDGFGTITLTHKQYLSLKEQLV